jgi:hypothetical protein
MKLQEHTPDWTSWGFWWSRWREFFGCCPSDSSFIGIGLEKLHKNPYHFRIITSQGTGEQELGLLAVFPVFSVAANIDRSDPALGE